MKEWVRRGEGVGWGRERGEVGEGGVGGEERGRRGSRKRG